jgi:hypothetical protein
MGLAPTAVWQRFESIVLKAETEHLSGSAEAKKVKSFSYHPLNEIERLNGVEQCF